MKIYKSSQRGLTIIELMIAMLLGIFLTAGIIQIFISAKQAYRLQENISRLQENGRFAMDFLTKGIRMAGFTGCASKVNLTNIIKDSEDFKALNAELTGLDNIDISKSTHAVCKSVSSTPSGWDCLAGTDLISFQTSGSCGGKVTSINEQGTSAQLKIATPNDCNIEQGDALVISNCSSATAFAVSNKPKDETVSGEQTITHGGNYNCMITPGLKECNSQPITCADDNWKLCSNYAPGDSEIFVAKSMSYFIRAGASGVPALYRVNPVKKDSTGKDDTPEELVEGIENMQILYGVDTDLNTTDCPAIPPATDKTGCYIPNYYVDASKVTDWQQVVSVRIDLLAVSIENNLVNEPQSYFYNGTLISPTDIFARTKDTSQVCPPPYTGSTPTNCTKVKDLRLHRVFSSTITIRNRLP